MQNLALQISSNTRLNFAAQPQAKKAGIITKYVHDQRQKINRKTLIGFHMPELKRELIL